MSTVKHCTCIYSSYGKRYNKPVKSGIYYKNDLSSSHSLQHFH